MWEPWFERIIADGQAFYVKSAQYMTERTENKVGLSIS